MPIIDTITNEGIVVNEEGIKQIKSTIEVITRNREAYGEGKLEVFVSETLIPYLPKIKEIFKDEIPYFVISLNPDAVAPDSIRVGYFGCNRTNCDHTVEFLLPDYKIDTSELDLVINSCKSGSYLVMTDQTKELYNLENLLEYHSEPNTVYYKSIPIAICNSMKLKVGQIAVVS